jgi:hypothetical protein
MIRNSISLKVVALTLSASILLAAGVYGVYKYSQVVGEKEVTEQQLLESKNREIEQLKLQLETSDQMTEPSLVENETVDASGTAEEKDPPVKEVVRTVTKYVPTPATNPAPSSKPPAPDTTTLTPASDEQDKLEIYNFNTTESGDSTRATWGTSIKSDSRILINDSFYVSDSNNSNKHSVRFTDLKKGVVINYEVIATTDSQEVSKFGKFSTRPGKLDVRFGYSVDEDCMVVVLEDEYGTAQPGVSLKISGTKISESGNRTRPRDSNMVGVTSAWGEVEYCNQVQEISVQNSETGDYYHNGRVYLF